VNLGGSGRQSVPGKAQTEAKTCSPHPDEVGGQEEAFSEETCGQEVVHEAEVIISGILSFCPQSIYSRYAIADEGMLKDAALKLARLHQEDEPKKDISIS